MKKTEDFNWILKALPYTAPFCFVDSLESVTDDGAVGHYTFQADAYFYKGHFKNQAVTPGVLLTECCAQIGLVCLGLHLLSPENAGETKDIPKIALSSSEMEFYLPVWPDERVRVESTKLYFRFNKLKCKVNMFNGANELVCKGTLAGMLKVSE